MKTLFKQLFRKKAKTVKFVKMYPWVETPKHATDGSAGVDFKIPMNFNNANAMALHPGHDVVIPLGVKAILPEGTALIMKNKSGVSTKLKLDKGAELVDCDFRGEIKAHVHNRGNQVVLLVGGKTVIQGVLVPYYKQKWEAISEKEFDKERTRRGEGGFGSTGN